MHNNLDDYIHKQLTWTVPRASREPSRHPAAPTTSITNALKTSLIYSRGMYNIPQHQSTLVFFFTRVIVAHLHVPIARRMRTLSQPAALSRGEIAKGGWGKTRIVPRDKREIEGETAHPCFRRRGGGCGPAEARATP